jgi:hypothetical protein
MTDKVHCPMCGSLFPRRAFIAQLCPQVLSLWLGDKIDSTILDVTADLDSSNRIDDLFQPGTSL